MKRAKMSPALCRSWLAKNPISSSSEKYPSSSGLWQWSKESYCDAQTAFEPYIRSIRPLPVINSKYCKLAWHQNNWKAAWENLSPLNRDKWASVNSTHVWLQSTVHALIKCSLHFRHFIINLTNPIFLFVIHLKTMHFASIQSSSYISICPLCPV